MKLQASRETPRTKFQTPKTCRVRESARDFDAPGRPAVRSKQAEQALAAPGESPVQSSQVRPGQGGSNLSCAMGSARVRMLAGFEFDQFRPISTKFDHFLFYFFKKCRCDHLSMPARPTTTGYNFTTNGTFFPFSHREGSSVEFRCRMERPVL